MLIFLLIVIVLIVRGCFSIYYKITAHPHADQKSAPRYYMEPYAPKNIGLTGRTASETTTAKGPKRIRSPAFFTEHHFIGGALFYLPKK